MGGVKADEEEWQRRGRDRWTDGREIKERKRTEKNWECRSWFSSFPECIAAVFSTIGKTSKRPTENVCLFNTTDSATSHDTILHPTHHSHGFIGQFWQKERHKPWEATLIASQPLHYFDLISWPIFCILSISLLLTLFLSFGLSLTFFLFLR